MPKKRGLLPQEISNPQLEAAKARTQELTETFQVNQLIEMLDSLIEEVRTMPIAKRFRPDQKIFSQITSDRTASNPITVGMSEQGHKRWQLERNLNEIKIQIVNQVVKFERVLMDIEATKTDG